MTIVPLKKNLTLIEHIKELRNLIIISALGIVTASIISYIFFDKLIYFLSKYFNVVENSLNYKLFVNSIFEAFVVKIKMSIVFGVVFTIPLHIYNIVRFIFPGLKSREKKILIAALIWSACMTFLGFYLTYFKIIPLAVKFLVTKDFIPENVCVLLNYSQNINYIFQFLIYSIAIFQTPIVLEILLALNILKRKTLLKYARYAVVIIFIVAAVITPGPDIISQLGIAIPLVILYFLTILVAKIFRFGEK